MNFNIPISVEEFETKVRQSIELVDCPKAPTCTPGMKPEKCTANIPKETTMRLYNDCEEFSPESNSLAYLGERSYSIANTKRTELMRKFGLLDDEAPKNAREFLERIASGMYVIPADKMDKHNYGEYTRFIEWRDPAKVKDQAGYDAAVKKLEAAKTKAEDTLTLFTSDPAKQLAALQEFESVTI